MGLFSARRPFCVARQAKGQLPGVPRASRPCSGGGRGGRPGRGQRHAADAVGAQPGEPFRFVFVTVGVRDAASANIADYDSFVNVQAGGATYSGVLVDWLAIGSTASVDAIDHVVQATAPCTCPTARW